MTYFFIKKEDLERRYKVEERSISECSKFFRTTPRQIKKHLIEYGIRVRGRYEYTVKRRAALKANKNIGSKTKQYYKNIKETGIIPDAEKRRRDKIGEWSKNYKRSKEHKEKIAYGLLGNKNCLCRKVSEETRTKISNSLKGNKNCLGRKHSDETKSKIAKSHLKENLSDEALQRYRETAIKRIEEQAFNGLPMVPRIGLRETEILNKYEKIFNEPILRQYKVAGYFVDGYCKERNIVIEVDEDYHKKRVSQDIYREEIIKRELGCEILRIRV